MKCELEHDLPRGLRCDRGFLIIRLKTPEGPYNKGCGRHTPAMEKAAKLILEDIRVKQKLNQFNLPSKLRRIRVEDAAEFYQQKWFVEYRDPETDAPRSPQSVKTNRSRMAALVGFFGNHYLDSITIPSLRAYRKKRIEYDDCEGATVNRDLSILGSMINCFKQWNLEKEIQPVQLPRDENGMFINPCEFFPDLKEHPRNRIATPEEIKRLKTACFELNDPGFASIIGTELTSALRKSDLKDYLLKESANGMVTLTQSKTGMAITLPKLQKPDWAKIWTNFDARWDKIRVKAFCGDLQFRDLRKTALRVGHEELDFTVSDAASLAGHSSETTTKKHYLDMNKVQGERNKVLVDKLQKWYDKL